MPARASSKAASTLNAGLALRRRSMACSSEGTVRALARNRFELIEIFHQARGDLGGLDDEGHSVEERHVGDARGTGGGVEERERGAHRVADDSNRSWNRRVDACWQRQLE